MQRGSAQLRWWQTRSFVAAMALVAILPLLWPTIPPLTDLPGHMGRYRVMLGTDADTLDAWYRFRWRPIGYLGVDLLVAALGPVLGLEQAVKLIVLLIPAATVAGLLWLSREAHGRVQPLALFALPIAYHLAFQYGFVNYTLAMALTLNALALWLRLGRQQRFRLRGAVFVPLSCLVWTAHLFGWLVLGLLAFAAETMRAREHGRRWVPGMLQAGIACLPLALPFAMFLTWHPNGPAGGSDWLAGLGLKPGWLVMVLRDRWRWFDIASIIVIALLLYRSVRTPGFGHAPALTAGAVGLLALFVAMPFGAAYADMRLAPYVVMLALLAVRADPDVSRREQGRLAAAGLAFVVLRTLATTASFAIESHDWDRHLAALDHVPRGARIAAFVDATCEQPWRMERRGHLPAMAIVRRAAFSNDQFDLGSTALMTVVAPGIAGFANDPSQIVMDRPCPQSPEFRTLPQALAMLPRARFDYVWLIDAPAIDPNLVNGMRVIWRDRGDMLLKIDTPRLSAPAMVH